MTKETTMQVKFRQRAKPGEPFTPDYFDDLLSEEATVTIERLRAIGQCLSYEVDPDGSGAVLTFELQTQALQKLSDGTTTNENGRVLLRVVPDPQEPS